MDKSQIEDLIVEYTRAAEDHTHATMDGNYKEGNRNADRIAEIYRQLRNDGLDAILHLTSLFNHPVDGVRCWAAAHTLSVASKESEGVLREIADGSGSVAFDAKMTLELWHKGELEFP